MTTPWHDGRVLLVQRDAALLASVLATEGLRVEKARDADAAIRLAEVKTYDVVVVDNDLVDDPDAGRTGAELVGTLAGLVATTAIVLLADDAHSGPVRAVNQTGAAVVLIRPLSPGELEAWVRYEVVSRRMKSRTLVA